MAKRFLTPLNLPNLASDPETGTEGDLYFNTISNTIKIYTNDVWTELQGGGASVIFQETQPDTSALDVGDIWVEHVPTPPEPDPEPEPEPEPVEIVSTNLVVNFDAGDVNSYPGTGTTWFNLANSSAGNATLVQGPTFIEAEKAFSFDGTDDHVTFANSADVNFPDDFSIDIWFYLNVNNKIQGLLVHRRTDSVLAGSWGLRYRNTTNKIEWENLFTPIVNTQIFTPSVSTWYHFVVSRTSGVMRFYANGVDTGITRTDSNNYTNNRLYISGMWGTFGGDYSPSRSKDGVLNGKIGAIKIYKGLGLSEAQVLQNYNALKDNYV